MGYEGVEVGRKGGGRQERRGLETGEKGAGDRREGAEDRREGAEDGRWRGLEMGEKCVEGGEKTFWEIKRKGENWCYEVHPLMIGGFSSLQEKEQKQQEHAAHL